MKVRGMEYQTTDDRGQTTEERRQTIGWILFLSVIWMSALWPLNYFLRLKFTAGAVRAAASAAKYSSGRKPKSEETTLLGKISSRVR
jgi:hypothetical protein